MEPLDPARALRSAENARTNEISDDELRARMGFLATARRRRQQQALVEREQELAEGHSGVRFSGYVTVSACSRGRARRGNGGDRAVGPDGAPGAAAAPRRAGDRVHLHAPALPGASVRSRPRHPAHQLTSAHLQAAYPFMGEGGLGGRGVYIGRDVYSGASFCFDPWVLYEQGALTGPSALVAGQVGRGKSALVKTYLARQALFGRRAVVIDPKGEYGPLAEWFGSRPIRLVPGGEVRLNPLDAAGGREERVALLGALVAGSLRRALEPQEHTALDLAYRAAAAGGAPTLPAVQHHLLHPGR